MLRVSKREFEPHMRKLSTANTLQVKCMQIARKGVRKILRADKGDERRIQYTLKPQNLRSYKQRRRRFSKEKENRLFSA